MNMFKRMKNFWVHLFEDFLWKKESENPRLLIESTLREYAKKQSETRKSLTSLVFYRLQLEVKLEKATNMMAFYQEKVEEFAASDRDDEAIELIGKLESLQEEKKFIDAQLAKLNSDIQMAQKLENDLKVKMVLAREKMEVLSGRVEAMRLRKKLKDGLSQISAGNKNWNVDSQVQKLEKEVFKLEMENADFVEAQDLEHGYEQWQSQKLNEDRRLKLQALKEKLIKPAKVEVKRLDYICT